MVLLSHGQQLFGLGQLYDRLSHSVRVKEMERPFIYIVLMALMRRQARRYAHPLG